MAITNVSDAVAACKGEGDGKAQVIVVSVSAQLLRLRLRVPAVLGLIGSCCNVSCCGKSLCQVQVVGVAKEGWEAHDGVEVVVQGQGADGALAWVVEAVAQSFV
jgi:hypothetical protein